MGRKRHTAEQIIGKLRTAAIGADALNPDTDGDGFEDGQEVLSMGTDPLDSLDPTPVRERRRKGKRRR